MTMRTTLFTAAVLFGLLGASVASAQYMAGYGDDPSDYQPWYYGHHSSTEAEGYLKGSAAVISSAGQYNLATAKAAIYAEDARSKAIENNQKAVEAYFAIRRTNREQREAEIGPRATVQELAVWAKEAAPKRLDGTQYEPALGRVFWPAVLQSPQFTAYRADIDRAMSMREPSNSGLGSDNFRSVKLAVDSMQETLKANVDAIPPAEYVQAKKFLTSLQWEAQHRMAPTGLVYNR
jgi:hypothetical protein